jgi:hypothetical protein
VGVAVGVAVGVRLISNFAAKLGKKEAIKISD